MLNSDDMHEARRSLVALHDRMPDVDDVHRPFGLDPESIKREAASAIAFPAHDDPVMEAYSLFVAGVHFGMLLAARLDRKDLEVLGTQD